MNRIFKFLSVFFLFFFVLLSFSNAVFVTRTVTYIAVKKSVPIVLKHYGKKSIMNKERQMLEYIHKNPKYKTKLLKHIDEVVAKNPTYKYNSNLLKDKLKNAVPNLAKNPMIIPKNGQWSGNIGNSKFFPTSLPTGSKYEIEALHKIIKKEGGIQFKNGYPLFDKYALKKEKLDIGKLTGNHEKDVELVKKQFVKDKDFKNIKDLDSYMKKNDLAYHHEPDMQTISLIPRILHESVKHQGGASILRGVK